LFSGTGLCVAVAVKLDTLFSVGISCVAWLYNMVALFSVSSRAVWLLCVEALFSGTGLGVLGAVKFDTPFPVGIPLSAVL